METFIKPFEIANWNSLLCHSHRIFLAGHTHPDGDAIGSLCATRDLLQSLGYSVWAATPDDFPDFLAFLQEDKAIMVYQHQEEAVKSVLAECDLVICLDMNSLSRMDALGKLIASTSCPRILVDHHLQPDVASFDFTLSRTNVSSCCELLYHLFSSWMPQWKPSHLQAQSLYAGIQTDTNQYANSIFEQTFRIVGELLACDIDKDKIHNHLFCTFSESRMRLMGYALLEKMRVLDCGVAYIVLDRSELNRFSHQSGDTEGFVNLPLGISNVRMSALFTKQEGFYRVSLRSKGDFPVNLLAQEYFEGGGHFNASGGKYRGTAAELAEVFPKIMEEFLLRHNLNGAQ